MKTMNVMRFNHAGQSPSLVADSLPIPQPKAGEILIRVCAAGVTPTERLWYPTTHDAKGGPRTGAIPGHEFSGVIAAVGPGVDAGQVGREVFGMNDWFADGASAEYCVTVESSVATKPANLSHAEAATVPVGALTAWQGLFDHAKLASGERVLIHGGAGAVGIFAVQFARHAGAHVIATASASSADFLRELGAHKVIDYRNERFEDRARGVDVVFDAVGGDTLKRSWDLLSPTGRAVTIAADSEGTAGERTKKAFFIMEPNQKQLATFAELIQARRLRCFVGGMAPLSGASDAYDGKAELRTGPGKIVLSIV
jgi:NADPH:quinone reductase-like Zn-dependent oxidoreductase